MSANHERNSQRWHPLRSFASAGYLIAKDNEVASSLSEEEPPRIQSFPSDAAPLNDPTNDDDSDSDYNKAENAVSPAVYLYAACAALNSVNLGYDLGVSTNAGPLVQLDFGLSDDELEMFLGCLNFFSIFGALISPIVTDRYGRRTAFVAAAIGFIMGIAIMATSPNSRILLAGRLLVGLSVGVGEAIDPMYIAEIAPSSFRGELVSWAEAGVAFGVVLGFCSSLITDNWRIMLGLGAILPMVMIVLVLRVMPESPRWLLSKQQEIAARVVLAQLYPNDPGGKHGLVDQVIHDIQESLALEQAAAQTVGWGMLIRPSPAVRRMLLVGVGIAIIQQAVGIDAIMFYLMFVIQASGISSKSGQVAALIVLGTVKLVFVFVGAKLFDRYGRRPLLFVSLLGCAGSLVVVSGSIASDSKVSEALTIFALAFYLAFFSSGLGPGNWVVVSEIFATSIRAKAMSVAVFPNRVTATVMASTFLSIANVTGWPGFFLILAGICLSSAAFLYAYLPETKGRSLESMAHYFAEVTGDRSILDMEEHLARVRHSEEIEMDRFTYRDDEDGERVHQEGEVSARYRTQ